MPYADAPTGRDPGRAMLGGVAETKFDKWIAQHYEALWPELFEPAFIEPTVDFLAELAAPARRSSSASAPGASRCR